MNAIDAQVHLAMPMRASTTHKLLGHSDLDPIGHYGIVAKWCCYLSPFIEPCLPSPGEQPPIGPTGCMRSSMMAIGRLRGAIPCRLGLLTRNGHDWTSRYPLIVQAVNKLKARSCLIDGEAVCCNEHGGAEL